VIFHNSIGGKLEERLLEELREKMLVCGMNFVSVKEKHYSPCEEQVSRKQCCFGRGATT
jgi:hypothetical protein